MGSGEKPEADIQRKTRLIKQLKQDAFIKTAVFIAVAVMSFTFIFGIAIVPTNDMFPAVHEGDMVIYFRPGRLVKGRRILPFSGRNLVAWDLLMSTGRKS